MTVSTPAALPVYVGSQERKRLARIAMVRELRAALASRGLALEVVKKGVHVVVRVAQGARVFDFWPGTRNWRERDTTAPAGSLPVHRQSLRRGYGIHELLRAIDASVPG